MRTIDSTQTTNSKTSPLHTLDNKSSSSQVAIAKKQFVIMLVITLLLAVGTGYVVAQTQTGGTNTSTSADGEKEGEQKESAGILDKETFSDTADGTLREGGIDGEGSFHLERPGGESQNVYLTSSTVDLSEFMGKKVTVWGQTFDSEKAGWLMDVGYIELKK